LTKAYTSISTATAETKLGLEAYTELNSRMTNPSTRRTP
jgi:hypothetical protein